MASIETIGDRLKKIRDSMSQPAFADLLEVTQNTIGRYERNERFPDGVFLTKVREKLGVDINWLLTGEETSSALQEERPPFVYGDAGTVQTGSHAAQHVGKEGADHPDQPGLPYFPQLVRTAIVGAVLELERETERPTLKKIADFTVSRYERLLPDYMKNARSYVDLDEATIEALRNSNERIRTD